MTHTIYLCYYPLPPCPSPELTPFTITLKLSDIVSALLSLSGSDVWIVFKHNKQDCLLMLITMVITFTFETSTGLAVGISYFSTSAITIHPL